MDILTEFSLFTGYGGFSLGLRLAGLDVHTVCYVEIDHYRQRIIQARIRDGLLDDAPIWDDIRTFDGGPWRGVVDIITAGFPCQPHSTAGKRLGEDDERNLWPDTIRVIREIRPAFVLLENVPGITQRRRGRPAYVGRVFGDLAEAGYDAIWDSVSAAEVGAPHLRQRWWCLAWHADSIDEEKVGSVVEGEAANTERDSVLLPYARSEPSILEHSTRGPQDAQPARNGQDRNVAYTDEQRLEEREEQELLGQCPPSERSGRATGWWAAEPDVGRVADGTPSRVDRLAAIGDGIVPAVVRGFLRGNV